jgi:hypothetical protein
MTFSSITLVTLLASLTLAAPARKPASPVPHIVGTYKLVDRVLQDGRVLTDKGIQGMMTYTAQYRNFNLHWTEADGRAVSIAYVCGYEFKNGQYCERPIYWMQNNLGEPGLKYDVPSNKADCTKVTMDGTKVTFAITGEPVVSFKGDSLTAVLEGQFVDHWVKVK